MLFLAPFVWRVLIHNICVYMLHIYVCRDECTHITNMWVCLRTRKDEILFFLYLGCFAYISFQQQIMFILCGQKLA